ncbi:MAG: acyl-CoA thioesterase, partial [Verrucomicrobiota bacterium]
MKQISIVETVMFYDTDCGGVVSNIAYLRFVERARSVLFEEMGMNIRAMNESQLFPAVIRTEIDYRSPARLGDDVLVQA